MWTVKLGTWDHVGGEPAWMGLPGAGGGAGGGSEQKQTAAGEEEESKDTEGKRGDQTSVGLLHFPL